MDFPLSSLGNCLCRGGPKVCRLSAGLEGVLQAALHAHVHLLALGARFQRASVDVAGATQLPLPADAGFDFALGDATIDVAIVANPPPGVLRGLANLRLIQSLWAGVESLLAKLLHLQAGGTGAEVVANTVERTGFFSEPSYTTVGEPYNPIKPTGTDTPRLDATFAH